VKSVWNRLGEESGRVVHGVLHARRRWQMSGQAALVRVCCEQRWGVADHSAVHLSQWTFARDHPSASQLLQIPLYVTKLSFTPNLIKNRRSRHLFLVDTTRDVSDGTWDRASSQGLSHSSG